MEDLIPPFEAALEEALRAIEEPRLADAARHLPGAGGKRFRPLLTMRTGLALGASLETTLPGAVAVELVHTFSLVHDDLMDGDATRRGRPTVHTVHGDAFAILAGDALYTLAYRQVAAMAPQALDVLGAACLELCEGQALDMAFEDAWPTVAAYTRMVEGKTGALFGASLALGALAAGHAGLVGSMLEAGNAMGVAFQVQDDLLDLVQSEDVLGKDRGSDLRAGKRTLIVLLSRETGRGWEVLEPNLGVTNPDVEDVVYALEKEHVLDEVRSLVTQRYAEARARLSELPDGVHRQALLDLLRRMEERDA